MMTPAVWIGPYFAAAFTTKCSRALPAAVVCLVVSVLFAVPADSKADDNKSASVQPALDHRIPYEWANPAPRLFADLEAAGMKELTQRSADAPSQLHGTARKTHNHMGWKWVVSLPPGKTWKLRGAVGRIPEAGGAMERFNTDIRIEPGNTSRIIHLEGHISREPGGDWLLLVEADRRVFQAVEFAVCPLKSDWEQIDVADYITGKLPVKASSFSSGLNVGRVTTKMIDWDRLDLLDARFEPDDGGRGSIAKQPARLPGFSIWIEAQK